MSPLTSLNEVFFPFSPPAVKKGFMLNEFLMKSFSRFFGNSFEKKIFLHAAKEKQKGKIRSDSKTAPGDSNFASRKTYL
jgi:hypothetical protein